MAPIRRWSMDPVIETFEPDNPTTPASSGKQAFAPIVLVGLFILTTLAVLQLVSPYQSTLALYRRELPKRFLPRGRILRYVVERASHPIISAMAACRSRGPAGIRRVIKQSEVNGFVLLFSVHVTCKRATSCRTQRQRCGTGTRAPRAFPVPHE